MKKRSIALASLLATAVLLSATLASGIFVHASPPTAINKETVRIAALTHREQGLANYAGWSPIVLPFEFNPKNNFLNVTKAWVTIVASVSWPGQAPWLSVELNDQLIHSGQYTSQVRLISIPIEDSNVIQTITPGINKLTIRITTAGEWVHVYEANVLVEYEYSTRK